MYYAQVCNGDYNKTIKMISRQEPYEAVEDCLAITIVDDDYPEAFWQLPQPPLCLFYRGKRQLLQETMIAIVGCRQPSEQSLSETKHVVKNLITYQ